MTSFHRQRRIATAVATVLAALALWAAPASAIPAPNVMVALGDSITKAFNSDGPGCPTGPSLDCPKNSWSTGTNTDVNSQFQRIQAIDPEHDHVAYNYAVSGARVGTPENQRPIDLESQAEKAAAEQDPDYVTIEIGGNDACRSTIADQTPTDEFRAQVKKALKDLVREDPQVHIQMLSIPDINQLHELFTDPVPGSTTLAIDPNAQFRWAAFNTCQALLANPRSTDTADVERRVAFQDQVIAYNGALAEVCAKFARCLFDNNAVFDIELTTADVANVTNTAALPGDDVFDTFPVFGEGAIPGSTADYFHPSLLGQAGLAEVSWNATFPIE
jgi:lysophospholipase L1-like esterase